MTVDDPGSWCLLIAGFLTLLLTLYLSTCYLALRHMSWVKLEEAFTMAGHAGRADFLHKHVSQLIPGLAVLSVGINLLFLTILITLFLLPGMALNSNPAGDIPEIQQVQSFKLIHLVEAFGIAVFLLSIFSVAVPHAWARYAGTGLIVRTFPFLWFIDRLTRPIAVCVNLFDPLVRRLAGMPKGYSNGRLEDRQVELLNAVEEGKKDGVVDEEEREMIESVLEFRATTTGEIMTPRTDIAGIEANLSISEAVDFILNEGYSRYPVYEETIDRVVGMLYAKDLLREIQQPNGTGQIKPLLRTAYFVPESKPLRDLLHDFQNQKIHVAVVLDEYGGTAGMVTIEDILEELVGEIEDEYESPQNGQVIKVIDQHTLEIDARCEVDELNDQFDLNIPEDEDYETIGGFAFTKLGYIPKTGEIFNHENLRVTVVDAGERKINRLRIEIIAAREEVDTSQKQN